MNIILFAALPLLAALSVLAPARAEDATVKVGTLSCHEASGWGFIFGSSRDLQCVFSGTAGDEKYEGAISKFGIDVGYKQSAVLVWAVLAPSTKLGTGALPVITVARPPG